MGDGRQHEPGVAQRRQIHEPDPVRVSLGGLAGDSEREPRLSDSAGADDRHQAGVGEEPKQVDELFLAPDQRVCRHRQVRAVEALERRELGRAELVHALGCRQVLEAVLAQVA
jgi:hypothetical protein